MLICYVESSRTYIGPHLIFFFSSSPHLPPPLTSRRRPRPLPWAPSPSSSTAARHPAAALHGPPYPTADPAPSLLHRLLRRAVTCPPSKVDVVLGPGNPGTLTSAEMKKMMWYEMIGHSFFFFRTIRGIPTYYVTENIWYIYNRSRHTGMC